MKMETDPVSEMLRFLVNREYGRRDPSRWPRGTLYLQTLAITSPTSGGRSVGIVRSRTQTMEFSFSFFMLSSYVEFRTMDKVKDPSDPECYTHLSEPFRFC
jgi:hypothetical protein